MRVFELSVGKDTISLAVFRLPLAGRFNEENSSQCHLHTLHEPVVHYVINVEFELCKQLSPRSSCYLQFIDISYN